MKIILLLKLIEKFLCIDLESFSTENFEINDN